LATVAALILIGVACSNPADNVPAAEVADASAEPKALEGQTFTFAEGSSVSFIGSKVTGSHDGGFNSFDGKIMLVGGDPAQSSVELTIDMNSLWSDDERLTGHLKSADFFEVETYPTATFASTEITAADEGGYLITGNLDLHGVVKSISFPAQIEVGPDSVTAQAEFSIMRFDFDVVYPGRPDDLIRDEVVIKLDIVAGPEAG
jgi:polyisoprenoid-binding protein YceI